MMNNKKNIEDVDQQIDKKNKHESSKEDNDNYVNEINSNKGSRNTEFKKRLSSKDKNQNKQSSVKFYGNKNKDTQVKNFNKKRNNNYFNKNSNRDSQYFYSKVLLTKKTDKVISGGRNSGFMAIVVVGNCIDRVGLGSARGKTIVDAISHAKQKASNRVIIPGKFNYTKERFCASSVIIKRRKINVIRSAGFLMPIFHACGMKNVSCKIIGSNNPMNCIYAVFSALSKNIQHRRNIIDLKQIVNQNVNTSSSQKQQDKSSI